MNPLLNWEEYLYFAKILIYANTYTYKVQLKKMDADQSTLMECDQMRFIF